MVLRPCKWVCLWVLCIRYKLTFLLLKQSHESYFQLLLEIEMISMLLVRSISCTDFRSMLVWTFMLEQEGNAMSKLKTVKSELFTD